MKTKTLALILGAVLLAGFLAGCAPKEEPADDVEMAIDPTCGMEVAVTEDALTHHHQGQTYYFCSEECRDDFMKNPVQYLTEGDKKTCPTCGMEVAVTDEIPSYDYRGETFYLCSEDCKVDFVADPDRYLAGEQMEMEDHHQQMHGN